MISVSLSAFGFGEILFEFMVGFLNDLPEIIGPKFGLGGLIVLGVFLLDQ
jgi:hypothetical protein